MTDENSKQNSNSHIPPNVNVDELRNYILKAEENLDSAKQALFELTGEDLNKKKVKKPGSMHPSMKSTADGKIIEGIFNGENMIGPEGKVFSVPANYASKSKLVEGDRLKLTVAEDGSFIFKQIGPVERKNLVGDLVFEDNMFHVNAEGKTYSLLYAAVTYHKAKPGDKVTIVVPSDLDSSWAALENIIHDIPTEVVTEPEEDILDLDLPEQNKENNTKPVEEFFNTPVVPNQPNPEPINLPEEIEAPVVPPSPTPPPVSPVELPETPPATSEIPQPIAPPPSTVPPVTGTSPSITPSQTILNEQDKPDSENKNSFGESVGPDEEIPDLEI